MFSPGTFGIALMFGAGGIALWLDVRYRAVAPKDLRHALLHVLVAMAVATFAFPSAFDATLHRGAVLPAVFGLALPCLVYVFVTTLWAMRHLQAALHGRWS